MEHHPLAFGDPAEGTPEDLDVEAAMDSLRGIDGVRDVHHVHAWSLTSGRNVFSGHIQVVDVASDGERVLRRASDELKHQFKVYFSTLQIEDERVAADEGADAIDITR